MKNVLIIGAGVAGRDVNREISQNPNLNLTVTGFIDDDPSKLGEKVNGEKVLGSKKDLEKIVRSKKVGIVIIATPSAEGDKIAEYVKICNELKVDVRIVPRVREIIEGKAHVKTLRKVRVEDLLGRPVVKADVHDLKTFFKGKTVLVTGAAGSIGSELSRQIVAYGPKKTVLFDWWENGMFDLENEFRVDSPGQKIFCVIGNIQDRDKLRNTIESAEPDYIFHAAAYKHVPLMEEYPEEAVKNNIFGTLNVIKEAIRTRAERLVLVSTDKAARPKNVMGMSKLFTEGLAKLYNKNGKTRIIVVRFGNVLDSFGSVVPIFRKQIEEGGPITITDKHMTRYLMTIPEAAQLILKAASMGKGGELFVLDMGEPVKIVDLAENMIRLSGYIPGEDIEISFTGKRKGEKIREILFNKKEKQNLNKTKDKKIFITESLGFDIEKLPKVVNTLRTLCLNSDRVGIRKEFSKLFRRT